MAHDHEHEHEHKTNGTGYETTDASLREVVLTGLFLAIGTILVCGAVYGLFKVLGVAEERSRTTTTFMPAPSAFPSEPRIEELPWLQLQQTRARENQMLSTYSWVDKNGGKVRIPIDRAMDMLVQQGLPVRALGDQTGGGSGKPNVGRERGNVPAQATGVMRNAPRK